MLLGAFSAQAKTYLVCAGIADYPGTANDLHLTANDARAMAWLFTQNQANNVEGRILLDSQATRANILQTIRQVFAAAKPNDSVIFFYSGHGYEGGFVAYDGMLPYSEMRDAMMSSKAKNKMIMADACFSGQFRDDANSAVQLANAQSSTIMLFLSSRSDEVSYERPGQRQNGDFTTYLVRGLRGRADRNRNRVVTARELFDYVSEGVRQLSGGKQHPVMWGNFHDNMPIITWPAPNN